MRKQIEKLIIQGEHVLEESIHLKNSIRFDLDIEYYTWFSEVDTFFTKNFASNPQSQACIYSFFSQRT